MPAARKADTTIVAIAPDPLDKLSDIVPKVKSRTSGEFAITLLSDADHATIDGYGLLNEDAAKRGRFVPHPTTYILDKKGVVRWKFTERDYKVRPSNRQILNEIERLP